MHAVSVCCVYPCVWEGGMSEEGKRMSVSVGGGERVVCVCDFLTQEMMLGRLNSPISLVRNLAMLR